MGIGIIGGLIVNEMGLEVMCYKSGLFGGD